MSKYDGCVAVPAINNASLSIGNDCVAWMDRGLSQAHVAELRDTAVSLANMITHMKESLPNT